MDRQARLYLCARCRCQVLLCSHCDRGQRYCTPACSRQARDAAQRAAARRYQRSRRSRMAHAARTRRWRSRRLAHSAYRAGANTVTHQGSQAGVVAAPLAAWTHDTASSPLDTAQPNSGPNSEVFTGAGIGLAWERPNEYTMRMSSIAKPISGTSRGGETSTDVLVFLQAAMLFY